MSIAIVTATATFTDSSGNLVTPTTVTLTVQKDNEDGVAQTSLSNPSTGVYTKDVTIAEVGRYTFTWYGQLSNGLERTAKIDRVIT